MDNRMQCRHCGMVFIDNDDNVAVWFRKMHEIVDHQESDGDQSDLR